MYTHKKRIFHSWNKCKSIRNKLRNQIPNKKMSEMNDWRKYFCQNSSSILGMANVNIFRCCTITSQTNCCWINFRNDLKTVTRRERDIAIKNVWHINVINMWMCSVLLVYMIVITNQYSFKTLFQQVTKINQRQFWCFRHEIIFVNWRWNKPLN